MTSVLRWLERPWTHLSLLFGAVLGGTLAGYYALRLSFVYPDRKAILGLPILGSMFELSTTTMFETLAKYNKLYGPVFDIFILSRRFTVLSAYEDVKETLLKRPKVFRRGGRLDLAFRKVGLGDGILIKEGSEWSKQRRVVAPPFSKQNIARLGEDIWVEASRFAEDLQQQSAKNEAVDFVYASTFFTLGVIGRVAFSFTDSNGGYFYSKQFLDDLKSLLVFTSQRALFLFPDFIWNMSPKYKYELDAIAAAKRVKECGLSVLEYARSQPQGDSFIHHILRASDDSKFSDEEVISNVLTFFVAGSDTTSLGICWALYFLSQNPSIIQDIRKEVNNLDSSCSAVEKLRHLRLTFAAVNEALRLRGSVTVLILRLVENTPYKLQSGVVIHPNDIVMNNLEGLKRDPKIFDDPEIFNPYRWMIDGNDKLNLMTSVAQITFGGGPRICPGMDLALMEATFCIANIIRHYDLELACPPSEIYRFIAVSAQINKMPLYFHSISG